MSDGYCSPIEQNSDEKEITGGRTRGIFCSLSSLATSVKPNEALQAPDHADDMKADPFHSLCPPQTHLSRHSICDVNPSKKKNHRDFKRQRTGEARCIFPVIAEPIGWQKLLYTAHYFTAWMGLKPLSLIFQIPAPKINYLLPFTGAKIYI